MTKLPLSVMTAAVSCVLLALGAAVATQAPSWYRVPRASMKQGNGGHSAVAEWDFAAEEIQSADDAVSDVEERFHALWSDMLQFQP